MSENFTTTVITTVLTLGVLALLALTNSCNEIEQNSRLKRYELCVQHAESVLECQHINDKLR